MSTTAERRDRIRKAMATARRAAIARREVAAADTQKIFRGLGGDVRGWIGQHVAGDGALPASQLGEFDAWFSGALQGARDQWTALLGNSFVDVIGMAEAFGSGNNPTGWLNARTLQWLNNYSAADGLQLSDRIWRIDQGAREAVMDTVRGAVVRGDSARQSAMRMIAEGKVVPADVSVTIRNGLGQVISDTVSNRIEGDVLRNALRVTRTEINRAYTEASVTSMFEHPDTGAVKFNLSPLHPRLDECDMHAKVNLYGLGSGVYPEGAHPYPAHPETLSFLTVVFKDEITDADRAGKQSAMEWLAEQPPEMRQAVLGKHKAEVFDAGELQESEILATWSSVRARLGR